ncbi:MAG: ABC-F family ATP-binding cassette domain-containing protein [Rhodobiaceae bacterium]|nr:ABC-F family ATP-binding cassette domain-containing protein [Rhodobiaceae bacterium]MCC0056497.1 ABC-F family ATP-binding cassette domain-containing protein [Rhodobiaceae bacterium]
MLHINDLSYRIADRLLLDKATVALPEKSRTGLVGRNGTGKTTLLRIIKGEIPALDGAIGMPRGATMADVAQEAPGGPTTLIDFVLSADRERAALMEESETATDPHRIADIQLRLTDIDAYTAPSRAARILAGLGFDEEAQQRPLSSYSGGWRMRVALAAVLFREPDILLLDEPTNYLDLEGTMWLERYLAAYPRSLLIVSHDRDLLNKSVDQILHLERGKLTLYKGGYDQFERQRRETQALQLKLKKKQDDQRRHMEAFVERFRAKATKARQAQSRLKALSRMEPIAALVDEHVRPFHLPEPQKPMGPPLIRFEEAAVGYEPGKAILRNLDLRIDPDDRIGLLGANGNGKSTFAKLLSRRLAVSDGAMRMSDKAIIGYFAQHQLDEINPSMSAYNHVRELMPDATEAQVRSRVAQIGFGADKADTAAGKLSGGEKARLMLALATFHGPHLLILDEPTNHLDIDSREMLVHALNDYPGAVILISHDRHLVEATADRLWLVDGGTVQPYDGDMDDYRRSVLSKAAGDRREAKAAKADNRASKAERAEERRQEALRRESFAPMRKKLQTIEKTIEKLNGEIARLDRAMADPALYDKDPAKATSLAKDKADTVRAIENAEEEWLAISHELEAAQAAE